MKKRRTAISKNGFCHVPPANFMNKTNDLMHFMATHHMFVNFILEMKYQFLAWWMKIELNIVLLRGNIDRDNTHTETGYIHDDDDDGDNVWQAIFEMNAVRFSG